MSGTQQQPQGLRRIPLPRQAYPLDSGPESAQDLLNLFAEPEPDDTRAPIILRSTPGLVTFVNVGAGPIYAMADLHGFLYVASGARGYRVYADGTFTDLGEILASVQATIAVGPTQVVFCCPPNAYVATHAGVLVQITDAAFPGASSVAYLNDRFIYTQPNTGVFFTSKLADGSVFDPLDFATQEAMPDVVKRGIAHLGTYWLFGADAIEVWYDAGATDFPFRRQSGAVIYGGTTTPTSIARLDNGLCYLGRDGIVYHTEGFRARRISTFALEQAILKYGDPATGDLGDVQGCSYTQQGHQFYCLTFPNASPGGRTWVYDAATNLWHRRSGADGTGRWRGRVAAQYGSSPIIGDATTGNVYFLAPNVATDNGVTVERLAVFPTMTVNQHRIFMARLEIEMEVGTGLVPMAFTVDWSDDGGVTYSTPRTLNVGAVGARRTRPFTTRLGSFRQRALRLNIVGYVTIYAADAILREGEA